MDLELDKCSESVLVAIEEENTEFLDEEFEKMTDNGRSFHNRVDESKTSILHFAIVHSSKRMVKYFLDKGLSPNGTTSNGQTSLQLAVTYLKYRAVKLLLRHGCSVDRRDSETFTALHYAMEVGKIPPHMIIAGARRKCMEERTRRQFASRANRVIICELLRYDADVNASTKDQDTPLFAAIRHGSKILIRLFLGHGANVNHEDANGNNALHYAVQKSSKDIVKIILDDGIDVNSTTRKGRTALHMAVARAYCEETVKLLIERGASVNAEDNEGMTPIFMPDDDEICDEDDDCEDMGSRYCNIMRSLLDAGADVNHVSNITGEPAFHRTISGGLEPIFELFLERGGDIHAKNRVGRSALHIAVEYASESVVKKLIDRGANVDDSSLIGATPLHLAVQCHKEKHIQLLIDKGADINATDVSGYTPLHYAARLIHLEKAAVETIVGILLDHGADPFVVSLDDKHPLQYALDQSNPGMVRVLLRHMADRESMGEVKATTMALHAIEQDKQLMPVYEERQREVRSMKETILDYFDENFWYRYLDVTKGN